MKSHLIEILLSEFISFLLLSFCMIAAIDFYHKALFSRNKINDIITNDVLS